MSEADECLDITRCQAEAPPEIQVDDPSILPETEAGPVEAGPPPVFELPIADSYPNFLLLVSAGPGAGPGTGLAAIVGPVDDTLVQGYVEPDDVASNTSENMSDMGPDPLSISFGIMNFVDQTIKSLLHPIFYQMFQGLHATLSNDVLNLAAGAKGFVGINKSGFLSKYTTVIYYAGRIPFGTEPIFRLMETCYRALVPIVMNWNTIAIPLPEITDHVEFACKHEKSPLQYDTQKIILCIKLKKSGNIIQIPILNVVGFPVFQDVNPLIGLVTPPSLPCFHDINLHGQTLSLLDIIVRVRICANQGAITALSEPSKEEVTLILHCFHRFIPGGVLPPHDTNVTAIAASINTITQAMRQILYTEANIKTFSLFCNIFYNFINVSLGFKSLAKIIYSDFFGTSDNYGKVIRACQVVNGLPIMRDHVKFFLTGSNAARVYVALNDIIKLGGSITQDSIAPILSRTFGNLSDNDFMIYLKNSDSEPYRVFIRMILGGSFYFFKDLFDPGTLARFTETMIQSVGIVGYMDHLFAQRFDATAVFLHRCYQKDPSSFLATMLQSMGEYFGNLDKQINVAHLDGVFKYYTLKKFYDEIFKIFDLYDKFTGEVRTYVYTFLINHATSINCIATVWTLVLNVLYTLFVPENCLARIVVGKFDNDPKNLKLYMEILNDHLYEVGRNSKETEESEFIKHIKELLGYQKSIIESCSGGINISNTVAFKVSCQSWVQTMVSMVVQRRVDGPDQPDQYKGLFMLSETDALAKGGRHPTRLERALCLAYYPTQQGNICSAASNGPAILLQALQHIFTNTNSANFSFPMDTRRYIYSMNELELYRTLNHMGSQMVLRLPTIYSDQITTNYPETITGPLSQYLNVMWSHLTKTAVHLKNFFRENVTDIKRVTGIKYIALVLGGYFQIRLLVDDVLEQCREDKRDDLISFKTSPEMMACKRGLLPLLIKPSLLALISDIVELDIQNELSHAAARAIATVVVGITPEQHAAAADLGITPERYTAAAALGISHQQYAAASRITPQQYSAAAALGITPEQYAAAVAAGAPAVATAFALGVTPELYDAASRITHQQYSAAAALGITPEQYAAAADLRITPDLYIRATNYTAAIATALGISPEGYDAVVAVGIAPNLYATVAAAAAAAVAALGISPQQYAAAAALGINHEQYAAAYAGASPATLGIAPQQYAAATALGITPDLYIRATNYTAAIAAALGISPQQYAAVAALGISPQQYAAAAALGINHEQYAAAYAGASPATLGIAPEKYAAAAALGITPEKYAAAAALGITPELYAAAADTLGITPEQYAAAVALGISPQQYSYVTTFAYTTVYDIAYNSSYKAYYTDAEYIKRNHGRAADICFRAAAAALRITPKQYDDVVAAVYDRAYTASTADIIPRILKILGFLFSIKVKSSSPHSPYQLLRLEDSILIFPSTSPVDPKGHQILNPTSGMFIEFLRTLGVDVTNRAIMKCICRAKPDVARIDKEIDDAASSNPALKILYTTNGGSITRSNRGKKLITDLNNHKHKHNKLSRNNRTHRNKNKRKKNSKSKSHKPKPKSKSKSGKSRRKNVTFKRRKRSNRR